MRFPEVGEVFAQKYRIEQLLGSGGFSRVYRATQLDLDRGVAIKILQPPVHLSARERDDRLQALISRFEREARIVSKLRSPHTITMYEYGRDEQGQLFMSLELVEGQTLAELVRREGALSVDRVVKIMRQVLLSLYEAHQLGMLHRDIKPANIMVFEHLGQRDQVKLLDFGIVKLIGSDEQRGQADLTSDDTLVGTPRYMAPEYIRGEGISVGSDLYSFGLVVYELLTGERAIQADSSIQIIGRQLERDSFYLPSHYTGIDPALRAIVNGMVEKLPAQRYKSAEQLLADLDARDANRAVPPPNAPRTFTGPPTDPTDRLAHAVTMRMSHIPPKPGHPGTLPTPSQSGHDVSDELRSPRLLPPEVSSDEDISLSTSFYADTLHDDLDEPTSRTRRAGLLPVLLVLALLLIGGLGAIASGLGSEPDAPLEDKAPTLSAESLPSSSPLPSARAQATPDDDTQEEAATPPSKEEEQRVEVVPEEDATPIKAESVDAGKKNAQPQEAHRREKDSKMRTTPPRTEPAPKTGSTKSVLLPEPVKDTALKTDASKNVSSKETDTTPSYKIIVPE